MLMKLACWRLLFHVEASVKVSVAVSICLDLPQPLVQARLIDQVLVFTLLSYVASFKYDNLVGVNERRQPMRNYERGLFAVAFANGIEDHRFGLAIDSGQRIIENEDGRITHQSPRDGDTLALAS